MSSNRIASVSVLAIGVALGYFAAGGFYQASQEVATSVEFPAPAMDATCSTASPDLPTCEMPGEISRADYFRLASTANAEEYAAQAAPQRRPEGSASADVAAEKSPATIMDQNIRQIRVERKVRDAFPMLPKPVETEK